MKQLFAAMGLVRNLGRGRSRRAGLGARAVLASPLGLALLLAATLPAVVLAADLQDWVPPEFIGLLDKIPLPFSPGPNLFVFSLVLGLLAGLAGGVAQACSGFMVAPALMGLGLPGLAAVGTDLLANSAFCLTGLMARKKEAPSLGKAAFFLALGGVPGAVGAGFLLKLAYFDDPASCDALIALAMVVLFGAFGFHAVLDFLRTKKQAALAKPPSEEGEELEEEEEPGREEEEEDEEGFAPPPDKLSGVEVGGKTYPVWNFLVIGLGMGFLAGLVGSSAGLGLFPVLCGWLPFPTTTAASTGLSAMFFTSLGAGAGLFAAFGLVVYTAAAGLVLGLVPGLALGVLATSEANPVITKALFAASILGCFTGRVLGLPLALARADMLSFTRGAAESMNTLGLYLVLVPAGLLGLWLLAMFFAKLLKLRDVHALSPLQHKKVLLLGSAPMLAFLAGALALLVFTSLGPELLGRAQAMANALVKKQADRTMELAPLATPYRGKLFKITLPFASIQAAERAAVVLHKAGLQVVVTKESLTVLGDTGRFMVRLLNTSQALYENDAQGAHQLLGLPAKQGGYSLWHALGVMRTAMAKAEHAEAAALLGRIRNHALVPAYNFYTVPTASLKIHILSGAGAALALLMIGFWWGGGMLITMETLGFAYTPKDRVLTPEEKEKLEQLKRRKEMEGEAKPKKKKKVVAAPPPAAAAKVEAEGKTPKKKKKKKKAAPADLDEAPKKKAVKKKKKAAKPPADEDAAPKKKAVKKKKKKSAAPAEEKPAKKKKAAKKQVKSLKLEL